MAKDESKTDKTRKPVEIEDLPDTADTNASEVKGGGRPRGGTATWDTGDEINN